MFLDIIALVLVIIAVFKGLSRGLVVGLFSFIGFIVGLAAALKLSSVVASFIGSSVNVPSRILPVLAFLAVFFVVVLLIRLGARIIEKVLQVSMLGWLNRLGGVVFYMLIYLFIFSVVLFYAEQLHVIKPETTKASVTYPFVHTIAPKMMSIMG